MNSFKLLCCFQLWKENAWMSLTKSHHIDSQRTHMPVVIIACMWHKKALGKRTHNEVANGAITRHNKYQWTFSWIWVTTFAAHHTEKVQNDGASFYVSHCSIVTKYTKEVTNLIQNKRNRYCKIVQRDLWHLKSWIVSLAH